MPSLGLVTNGRPDLTGPLAQLALGRDGTFYLVAAGLANHAGPGVWQGINTGNTNFIGIEAENTGLAGDAWPEIQMDAYARGVAAILNHIGAPSIMCCGHKEYALPPGRKIDPSFDMTAFRKRIDAIMAGVAPASLIPASDDQGRPTLRRGATGDLVTRLQIKLAVDPSDGVFGPATEAAVRLFQRSQPGLTPDGIVGPRTWAALNIP
jgi:N-acetyl-anhydromuramyl-L-alanine amidase AmpD